MKLLAGLTVRAGTKIELPADVTGKPDPRIKWTKADVTLKTDNRITIDTQPGHTKVTIADTTRGDTATYIIEAVNSSGRATATIDVNILGLYQWKRTENQPLCSDLCDIFVIQITYKLHIKTLFKQQCKQY